MREFTFSFLAAAQMPTLRHTFLRAFANYQVPVQLNETQFATKIKREGILPTFCVAAFAATEMVGFILTGLGEWQGKPTAYNAGTGVIAAYRGHHITQQLYRFLLPKLWQSGVEQCLLEVITDNAPALKSYYEIGFRVSRTLESYRVVKQNLLLQAPLPAAITFTETTTPDWTLYTCFGDVEPSWQNMAASFKRSPDKKIVIEARDARLQVVGFIAFFPENGAIVQVAVQPQLRGRGIGTGLLREAVQRIAASALMFINVDTTSNTLIRYLKHRQFTLLLTQYEMVLSKV